MIRSRRLAWAVIVFLLGLGVLLAAGPARAQQLDANSLKGMKWRLLGPFRGVAHAAAGKPRPRDAGATPAVGARHAVPAPAGFSE